MGNQGYRSSYLAAFEGANYQLENIYSEYHELQRRKEKLEGVLMALEPFLQTAGALHTEAHSPEMEWSEPSTVYSETYSAPQPAPEPMRAERSAQAAPAPPAFSVAEEELDPLQLRINRALGLAVA